MINLSKLIFETVTEPDELDKDEIFGQYFSPKHREITTDEKNTPAEDTLIDALESMLIDNEDNKLQKNIRLINHLMITHKYERVFEPGDLIVTRGIRIFEDEMMLFIKTNIVGNEAKFALNQAAVQKYNGEKEVNGQLKPAGTRFFQSWSTNKHIADTFSTSPDDLVGLIFYAKTNENTFFGKPRELATAVNGITSEEETLSVGPVKFFRIEIKQPVKKITQYVDF